MIKRIKTIAQASMEFLMSYAWAIMIVLIVIGVLAYFGVVSPSKFLPSSCIVEPGIACVDYKIIENSVTLVLRNGKGEDIDITSISVERCQGSDSGFLKNGDLATFNIGNCNFEANKKIVLVVNLTYINPTGLVHKKVGKITDIVELTSNVSNATNVTNVTLSTDLVAYWKLNESSGTRFDSKGSNHLIDLGNNITNISGKIGNAANFTLWKRGYLGISDNTNLSLGNDTNFTLTVWVYFNSKPSGERKGIAGKWNNGAFASVEYHLHYDPGGDRILFVVGNSTSGTTIAASIGSPSLNTWYFIVAWHDSVANTINIQIDNGVINSITHSSTYDGNQPFTLGATNNGATDTFFDGRIDEVGFWKRILTDQERVDLYNNGNGYSYNP